MSACGPAIAGVGSAGVGTADTVFGQVGTDNMTVLVVEFKPKSPAAAAAAAAAAPQARGAARHSVGEPKSRAAAPSANADGAGRRSRQTQPADAAVAARRGGRERKPADLRTGAAGASARAASKSASREIRSDGNGRYLLRPNLLLTQEWSPAATSSC
jgi:hypothetical protein